MSWKKSRGRQLGNDNGLQLRFPCVRETLLTFPNVWYAQLFEKLFLSRLGIS